MGLLDSDLTLGELEAPACFTLSVFFTFDAASVTSKVATLTEERLVFGTGVQQGSGNTKDDGARLSGSTTTGSVDEHINALAGGRWHSAERR